MIKINLMPKHKCDYPKLNHYGKCIAYCIYNNGVQDCAGKRVQLDNQMTKEVKI